MAYLTGCTFFSKGTESKKGTQIYWVVKYMEKSCNNIKYFFSSSHVKKYFCSFVKTVVHHT